MASADGKLIAQLREDFKKNYLVLPYDELEEFDERDINRIFNDDLFALSFVRWKKEVIKDAVELLAKALEWRKENNIADISVESVGEEFIKRGVCYVYGRGVDGTRVLALIARLQMKDENDKVRKTFMFWLERLQRNEPGQHVTFILDAHKTGMSNVDLGMIRFIIDSFSIYFPDLLGKIIVLDLPWILNAIWNIAKKWMSEEQRSKVVFCSRNDLHKFVATDQRPISMGGTVDWTFSFPPFPDDMSQDHHFKNDPMNIKRESEENEEIRQTSEDQTETPSISDADLVRTPTNSSRPASMNPSSLSSPGSQGMQKTSSFAYSLPISSTDDETKFKRRHTINNMYQYNDEKPSNVSQLSISTHDEGDDAKLKTQSDSTFNKIHDSDGRKISKSSFRSVTTYDDIGGTDRRESGSKMEAQTKLVELALGNLLFVSPVSKLVFTLEGKRFESHIYIRNPNPLTAEDKDKVYVAYKVKTTSPERHHVRPSIGVVSPGEAVCIRIHLNTASEALMVKDSFLLLYKRVPVEGGNLPSRSEIVKFWKQNSDKSLHHEHRVNAAVDASNANAPKKEFRKASGHSVNVASSKTPSPLSFMAELPKRPGFLEERRRILHLHNKITSIESDTQWMRRRMRHTMGLLFVVILLMCFIVYEIALMPNSFLHINLATRMQDSSL